MTMQRFWPGELPFQPTPQESRFLEAALQEGHRPYVSGIADFGAVSQTGRAGEIIVRGPTRREVVLTASRKTVLAAFVDGFPCAAEAVLQWLRGATVEAVLGQLEDHLVVLSGMERSHVVFGPVCEKSEST